MHEIDKVQSLLNGSCKRPLLPAPCSPLIVHRDVKSNNILLNSDFEAHAVDFGLTKFLQDTGTSECIRDHPSLRHKAADFKFRVLDASNSVFSEITADPVFHCMIEHMKKATNCGGEEDVCVICLDAFDESIDLDIQTECGHRFHDRCIYGWINSGRSTCPMCRFNVL
ncbi:hypothetical protein Scep_022277 [Stephania cephalantha]|uniref:RING-type E3 ubiquitin transferase n=1 Tax=Stephania cephalantha TaxID=152367 RepID=A0AAP0HXL7_9MAGN